jgi:hypothetical protein
MKKLIFSKDAGKYVILKKGGYLKISLDDK